jgi:hypothetical protein
MKAMKRAWAAGHIEAVEILLVIVWNQLDQSLSNNLNFILFLFTNNIL